MPVPCQNLMATSHSDRNLLYQIPEDTDLKRKLGGLSLEKDLSLNLVYDIFGVCRLSLLICLANYLLNGPSNINFIGFFK